MIIYYNTGSSSFYSREFNIYDPFLNLCATAVRLTQTRTQVMCRVLIYHTHYFRMYIIAQFVEDYTFIWLIQRYFTVYYALTVHLLLIVYFEKTAQYIYRCEKWHIENDA